MHDNEEFLDPYLDPETGILRNLIGAGTKESLDDAEGSLSFARLVQLIRAWEPDRSHERSALRPPRSTAGSVGYLQEGFEPCPRVERKALGA